MKIDNNSRLNVTTLSPSARSALPTSVSTIHSNFLPNKITGDEVPQLVQEKTQNQQQKTFKSRKARSKSGNVSRQYQVMFTELEKLNNPILDRPSKRKMIQEYAEDTLTKYIPDKLDCEFAKYHKDSQ